MKRRGLGKGTGNRGYYNLMPMDSYVHSLSAKGIKSKVPLNTKAKSYTGKKCKWCGMKSFSEDFCCYTCEQEYDNWIGLFAKGVKVYHGTDSNFNKFDKDYLGSKSGETPSNMVGFYFTNNKKQAKTFGKNIKTAIIDIKKPYIINAEGMEYSELKDKINEKVMTLNKSKYDGIIIKNYKDAGKYSSKLYLSNQYIPFKLNQIEVLNGKLVGSKIPVQLTIGTHKIDENKIVADEQILSKPKGYLWTSDYTPENEEESSWVRWTKYNMPTKLSDKGLVLYPDDNANVFAINTEKDIKHLVKKYGSAGKIGYVHIDWEKVKKDYDGVRLSSKMLYKYRLSGYDVSDIIGQEQELSFNLWDVPSTVWFKAPFKKQEKITIKSKPVDDY